MDVFLYDFFSSLFRLQQVSSVLIGFSDPLLGPAVVPLSILHSWTSLGQLALFAAV